MRHTKRNPSDRLSGTALASRNALAGVPLLAGHAVLARDEAVVAEADPLGLDNWPHAHGRRSESRGGSGARSDHASPERAAFFLPRVTLAAAAQEDDLA